MTSSSRAAARFRLAPALALSATALLVLSGCATATDSAEPAAPGAPSAPAGDLGSCGVFSTDMPADPDGILAGMPEEVQHAYAGSGLPVEASPWADWSHEGPLVVGISSDAPANAFVANGWKVFKEQFEQAKKDGLIDPASEIREQIMVADTQTAAAQVSGFQSLVRGGADVIVTHPLSSEALAESIAEAGKAGVPTLTMFSAVDSEWAVNYQANPFLNTANPVAQVATEVLKGEGDVLIVRGIKGMDFETSSYEAAMTVLDTCEGIEVVGEVEGAYNSAQAKAEVLKFLSTYPGQIDAVIQLGTMGPGVVSAFEQLGKPMPAFVDIAAQAGTLSYWLEHQKDGYSGAGTAQTGAQVGHAMARIVTRMASGEGLTTNNIMVDPGLITDENLADYAVEGVDLNSPDEPNAPIDTLPTDDVLAGYFSSGAAG